MTEARASERALLKLAASIVVALRDAVCCATPLTLDYRTPITADDAMEIADALHAVAGAVADASDALDLAQGTAVAIAAEKKKQQIRRRNRANKKRQIIEAMPPELREARSAIYEVNSALLRIQKEAKSNGNETREHQDDLRTADAAHGRRREPVRREAKGSPMVQDGRRGRQLRQLAAAYADHGGSPDGVDECVDASGASKITGMAVATLATLRCRGGGPPFIKYNRSVRYSVSALQEWRDARVVSR